MTENSYRQKGGGCEDTYGSRWGLNADCCGHCERVDAAVRVGFQHSLTEGCMVANAS